MINIPAAIIVPMSADARSVPREFAQHRDYTETMHDQRQLILAVWCHRDRIYSTILLYNIVTFY